MEHAWVSSEISSFVLIRRASRNSCCPSTTSMPARCSASSTGISAMSMPTGAPSRPRSASSLAILRASSSAMPASGWNAPRSTEMPARARFGPSSQGLYSWWWRAAEPKSQTIGSRPAAQQGEPDELVHRPRADVRRRHVADVREVEGKDGAQLGALQLVVEPGEPLLAQPVEVDALLPSQQRSFHTCRSPLSAPSLLHVRAVQYCLPKR